MSNTDDAFLALTLALCIKKKKGDGGVEREWLKLRDKCTHENLLREIYTEPEDYANFLRMDHKTFEELLAILRPRIEKMDTVMRKSISASQRLSITLRYLASGADFEDLKCQACIAPRTLGDIIIATCEAINETLSNNIQVRFYLIKSQNILIKMNKNFVKILLLSQLQLDRLFVSLGLEY
ncbi:unnamed protein product [Arctia plantaginis]|uniref:Uncharacterized protein n=1 Tax=Arctia plantaginis TaxID=874455 RepID=A0A8S0ZAJ3_ARCPL|nr:unnamed protein product [Arctia plantaginis]